MAAPRLLDMVLETATNPGTGAFTLNGAPQGRRSFAAALPNGGEVCYFADDGAQAEWGVGTLTVGSPNTLARKSILGTTTGSLAALNFTASVRVYSSLPSALLVMANADGSVDFQKAVTVQAVSDWTKLQPVGAKDGDARYTRKYADQNATAVDLLTVRAGGVLAVQADGQWYTLQPTGDYATADALSGVETDASAASDAANQNAEGRVSKSGDNMSGDLNIVDGKWLRASGISYNSSDDGLALLYGEGSSKWLKFQDDGNIVGYDASGAFVSLSRDAFTWGGKTVAVRDDLPLPSTDRMIRFSISNVASGARVNFPSGFSGDDVQVFVTDASSSGVAGCNAGAVDRTGFTLRTVSNVTIGKASVLAIGPR